MNSQYSRGRGATRPPRCGARASQRTAYAQQQATQGLEEIIVTARKVEENLQETPIAITALTGSALEDRQVFSTDMLDQVVPNLQFANNAPLAGNNSSSQVFIRGIGQTDPTSTVDPGVGLYIDDVYIGNAVGGTMALRDIAIGAGAARPAGHAVRPQHDRRRDPADDDRSGR